MKISPFKFFAYLAFFILSTGCYGQGKYSDSKFNTNFSIEQLIVRDWEFKEVRLISSDDQDTSIVSPNEGEMKCLHFSSKNIVLYHDYPLYANNYATRSINLSASLNLRTYRIVQNWITEERRLIISERGGATVFRNFRIEEFTFNRLVITDVNDTLRMNEEAGKRLLIFELEGQEAQTRSLGAWLHYGNLGINNLSDTDSLRHEFIRVKKGEDIRDSLEVGDIAFQIELLTDGTYFTFCTGGVLGSVNVGKYKIDLMNQKLYFFEKDHLVYDYYFNSDHEIVLDISRDSKAVDN